MMEKTKNDPAIAAVGEQVFFQIEGGIPGVDFIGTVVGQADNNVTLVDCPGLGRVRATSIEPMRRA
ncbi:MAG: hypothetical protein JXR59_11755 [Desulfuromonadaceae bacterium]|nr:hypothetical protein [Desulfuromonadaceae bacterium]